MTLTEAEAASKWCPHVRYQWQSDPSANRWKQSLPADEPHALNPEPCRCIASECMAWRWAAPQRENLRSYADDPDALQCRFVHGQRVYPGGWQYSHTDIDADGRKFDVLHRPAASDEPTHGFCGLAGKVGV